MAWQQSDLNNIDAAIASAELTVRFGDRMVTYRSVAELLKARDAIVSSLAEQTGTVTKRHLRIYTNSGW
jgi:hypothetical protein